MMTERKPAYAQVQSMISARGGVTDSVDITISSLPVFVDDLKNASTWTGGWSVDAEGLSLE